MSLGSRSDYFGGHVLVTEANSFLWCQKQQEISCHFHRNSRAGPDSLGFDWDLQVLTCKELILVAAVSTALMQAAHPPLIPSTLTKVIAHLFLLHSSHLLTGGWGV